MNQLKIPRPLPASSIAFIQVFIFFSMKNEQIYSTFEWSIFSPNLNERYFHIFVCVYLNVNVNEIRNDEIDDELEWIK